MKAVLLVLIRAWSGPSWFSTQLLIKDVCPFFNFDSKTRHPGLSDIINRHHLVPEMPLVLPALHDGKDRFGMEGWTRVLRSRKF